VDRGIVLDLQRPIHLYMQPIRQLEGILCH